MEKRINEWLYTDVTIEIYFYLIRVGKERKKISIIPSPQKERGKRLDVKAAGQNEFLFPVLSPRLLQQIFLRINRQTRPRRKRDTKAVRSVCYLPVWGCRDYAFMQHGRLNGVLSSSLPSLLPLLLFSFFLPSFLPFPSLLSSLLHRLRDTIALSLSPHSYSC